MGKLVSIIEASRRFGLTEQTMRNWISNGYIDVKSVGKARYIDEDTINALQDTAEDIKRQQMALESIRDEMRKDYMARYDDKTRKRYLNVVTDAACRVGLFDYMLRLLALYGSLTEREAVFLIEYIRGESLEAIGRRYGMTRERARQIIEKAIHKGRDLTKIEERFQEADQVTKDNAILKAVNESLRKQLERYEQAEKNPEAIDENDELCRLLSTKLTDCNLSVRALNCLISGRTDRRFSFKNTEDVVVVPPCRTIGDVCRMHKTDFLKIRNAGKKSLYEIDEFLESKGLSWGMDVDSIYKNHVNKRV